uniref:Amiloride-sensitive sodium channel n=1 Tax=Globodera rostochiensis TaxID=31243 RepID=A0A914HUZ6_GLORO
MAELRTPCFYLLILFLFGFTVFDAGKIVLLFLGENKDTDMFVVFNDTITMPNITFCMFKDHAWSHFKLKNLTAHDIDEAVQKGMKKMESKNDFLNTPWDDLMVIEAFQSIAALNSMEIETSPTGFVHSVNNLVLNPRMAGVRETWKKWLDAIAKRGVRFEELRQKVGYETVLRSLKRFQRMGGGTAWKPIQDVKITWLSVRQLCFQPLYNRDEFKNIEEQDQFFEMLLVHGNEMDELKCMLIDLHGRPGEEARYLEGKGRAKDGINEDLCLSDSHELVVEVREIQTLLPGAEELEEKCVDYALEEEYKSELECQSRCRLQIIRNICNCTAHTLEKLAGSADTLRQFPLCDYTKCHLNATDASVSNWEETLKKCTAKCYPDCNQIRYRLTKNTKTAERDDSTEVKLFWGSFEYLRLVQKQKWSLSKFVSNLGGSLGVWLGLSVVSIVQFISFLMLQFHNKMMQKESASGEEGEERHYGGRQPNMPSSDSLSNQISMRPLKGSA